MSKQEMKKPTTQPQREAQAEARKTRKRAQ